MATPNEQLIDHVVELAQDALRAAKLADGADRLHWLVQARVHVDEGIAYAKATSCAPRSPT